MSKPQEDKFKVGDSVYWRQPGEDLEDVAIGTVVQYEPEGIGWLDWVKYKVEFQGPKGTYSAFLGNDGSPDVWCSKVLSKSEYELAMAKEEYEAICDHGNGD